MREDKAKREKRLNMIGAGCGLFLALLLVINISSGVIARAASANAQTLTASAPGKVGDVTVQVKADDKKIYEVTVTEHSETEGIGTMAVDQIPGQIVEKQTLALDAVSGATVTSDAIRQAVALALQSGGIDSAAFGMERHRQRRLRHGGPQGRGQACGTQGADHVRRYRAACGGLEGPVPRPVQQLVHDQGEQ